MSPGEFRSGKTALAHGDYKLVQQLSSEQNSEKCVWRGTGPKGNCALCFPKAAESCAALRREAAILKHIGAHENVIGLIDLIENWGGRQGYPCLILELVEPLGYDMFEAFYQQLLAGQMSVPTYQVRHYVVQLAAALRHLHDHGIIHRDLKVDQVLIKGQAMVKLIDFGMALGPKTELSAGRFPGRGQYIAPELRINRALGGKMADLWGIGIIIFSLCSGKMPLTVEIELASKRGGLRNLLTKRGLEGAALEACEKLLHHDPASRWTLDDVQAWAGRELLSPSMTGATLPFQRWSSRVGETPQVFGLNIPEGWKHHGQTIGQMNISGHTRMLIMLVIREGLVHRSPEFIVSVPGPETELRQGDWLCFGLGKDIVDIAEQKAGLGSILGIEAGQSDIQAAVERSAKSKEFKGLYPFLPEFDMFDFPEHCANSTLGPAGANALDLRRHFGINLAGIRHSDGSLTWFPGKDQRVRPQDSGLLVRVPPPGSGPWESFRPSLTRETWVKFSDVSQFRETMELRDEGAWNRWMTQAAEATDSPTPRTAQATTSAASPDLQTEPFEVVGCNWSSCFDLTRRKGLSNEPAGCKIL